MKNSGGGGDNTPNPEKVKTNHDAKVIKVFSLPKPPLSFNLDTKNIVYITEEGQFYLSKYTGLDKQGEIKL